MTEFNARFSSIARVGLRASCLALAASAGLAMAERASAQTFRLGALGGQAAMIPVQAEASNPETVRLLIGLSKIRADLQLGMLALGDGLTLAEGSPFARPRKDIWPGIKDGLLAAGVPDFEPVLQNLEQGGGKEAVTAAYHEAEGAILKAHSTLRPSAQDMAITVMELARASAAEINASGPTEVRDYQEAWALLMVARGELDLLSRSTDPAMAKLAQSEAMAIDDILISMPDPNQIAPVAFDPAPILELIGRLEGTDEAA